MNRKTSSDVSFPCERNSLEEAFQMSYGLNVKTIPLVYGGCERLDENLLECVSQVPGDVIRMSRNKKSNVGIELGHNSRNLFVATFSSKADYDEMRSTMRGYDKWVSTEGSNYNIWFFLKDGIAEDCQTLKYKIQAQGIILAPPSVDQNGGFCSWLKREDIFPPSLHKDEIKDFFPQFNIKALNPQYLDDLQLNIKNEEVRQAIVFASTVSWPGRSGTSLCKVYIALCLRANQESIDNFRASDREVSEIAATSDKTARIAKKVLIKIKAVYPVENNSITNHYRLNRDFFRKSVVSTHCAGLILPILNNDAFSRTGINPSGARIYSLLLINPQATIKGISQTIGIGYSTAKKEMQILKDNNLVVYKDGRWFAIPGSKSKLKKIAESYGVCGKAKKRKMVHKQQRAKFISSSMWKVFKKN
jgi:hypothetical protein